MEIINYPNYLIYPNGDVWSILTKRFLKTWNNGNGYIQVGLNKNGKRKNMFIHRLIALHYIPNPKNKKEIDHIDNIKSNNNIENLRWVTHSENNRNKSITGCIPFRGVCKKGNKFKSQIKIDNIQYNIGCYETALEASIAYEDFAITYEVLIV